MQMNESHHTYPQEEHTAANAKLVVPFGKPPDPNEEVERAIYSHTKEPYIHTQKSPIHSKEPQKPLYTRAAAGFQRRGPCAHSKEPYIHTQKSHIHSKEPQKPRNKGVLRTLQRNIQKSHKSPVTKGSLRTLQRVNIRFFGVCAGTPLLRGFCGSYIFTLVFTRNNARKKRKFMTRT